MANPFLVLGGIAVGVVTAAFGILQVPGWVSSAQDASAKNDIAQVSILQSASLSQEGVAQDNLSKTTNAQGADVDLGVDVSTQAKGAKLLIDTSDDRKDYAVIVVSESGNAYLRVNGAEIQPFETADAAKNLTDAKAAAVSADPDFTFTPAGA